MNGYECFNSLVLCFFVAILARAREQTHGRDWFTVLAMVLAGMNAVAVVLRIVVLVFGPTR